jgi:hypothetical protein
MDSRTSKETWGFGIEHEMHIFHKPSGAKPIQGFIIFNSEEVIERIVKDKENGSSILTDDEYKWLKTVPFETSGRLCNGQWVIQRVPFKMPEFITFNPFFDTRIPSIENMVKVIIQTKLLFIEILMRDKKTQQLVKKYGELVEYPTGFSRHIYLPLGVEKGKYIFEYEKKKKELRRVKYFADYTGSYHITITLPHSNQTTNATFTRMHQNFANQLQWLEPLMIPAYFSGDEYAPGSVKNRVRGSFRVMIIGWGNFAGSDVRLFDKGIGRYAKTETFWRRNIAFDETHKLEPCIAPSPSALEESGITSLSSDFRTFGSISKNRPEHRVSGLKMTKPNGVEFRIFDHFLDAYIIHLVQLICLVAENSRTHKTTSYVYQDKGWTQALHQLMQNGYKTILPEEYITSLKKHLGLKIRTSSRMAEDVFETVYLELVHKNVGGKWMNLFLGIGPKYLSFSVSKQIQILTLITNPKINRISWAMGFVFRCHSRPEYMKYFKYMLSILQDEKTVLITDMQYIVEQLFGKAWKNDVVDICFFIEDLGFVRTDKNSIGEIQSIEWVPVEHVEYNNWNNIIEFYYEIEQRMQLRLRSPIRKKLK